MHGKVKLCGVSAVFLVAAVMVCGCGFFEPRTPERPGGGGTWIPPTTPEIVLENMTSSMAQKVIGNYRLNFTNDFVFHPDPSDSVEISATQAGVYDNWNDSVEVRVAQILFDEASRLDLTFTKRDTTVYLDTDHCVFYYKYLLQVTLKAGGTEFLRGLVEYHLRREAGANWYIYVWIDKRDPDFRDSRTWGYRKGTKRPLD